jgi:hypothetical protein
MTDETTTSPAEATTPMMTDESAPASSAPRAQLEAHAPPAAGAPPVEPPPPMTAEAFVQAELVAARAALKMTQVVGSLLVLILGLYLIVVTTVFVSNLQPKEAASVVDAFVSEQIDTHRDAFVAEVAVQVPAMIQQTPDLVLQQIPLVRTSIEDTFETELRKQFQTSSDKLNTNLEDYIAENKAQIQAVIAATKDPRAVSELGPSIREEVMAFLKEKPATGTSIDAQITDSVSMLRDAERRLHHLATSKKLTPAEKKTRRAIAVIVNTIEKEQITPITLPKMELDK